LLAAFEHRNYGWPYAAVLCVLAKLIARGRVELNSAKLGTIDRIEDQEASLRNSKQHEGLDVSLVGNVAQAEILKLKKFCNAYFDMDPVGSDAKQMAGFVKVEFSKRVEELNGWKERFPAYRFIQKISEPLLRLQQVDHMSPMDLYGDFLKDANTNQFLDDRDSVLDPISDFIKSTGFEIFQNAQRYLQENRGNASYVSENYQKLSSLLEDEEAFNKARDIKTVHEALRVQIENKIKEVRGKAFSVINDDLEKLQGLSIEKQVSQEVRTEIERAIDAAKSAINETELIDSIKQKENDFTAKTFPGLLEICQPPERPKKQVISIRSIDVHFAKAKLSNHDEVEAYVEELKAELNRQLDSGKDISL